MPLHSLNAATPAPVSGGENTSLDFLNQLGGADQMLLYLALGSGLCALGYGFFLRQNVLRRDAGTPAMQEVAQAIQAGSRAYLKRQFGAMIYFVVGLAIALAILYAPLYGAKVSIGVAGAFFAGAMASYCAGYTGMMLAVQGNVRVAAGALRSFKDALEVAFQSGAVAGMMTVGLGLSGASLIFMIFRQDAMKVLIGFGLGCALVALFMRIGGGIYTKAADVGADLVGKVEANIPEDDPRNAATIADNVGDNVGDCAGMAADVFESYIVTLVAAIILGAAVHETSQTSQLALHLVLYPLVVCAMGVFASILGILAVRGEERDDLDPMQPIQTGFRVSAIASTVGFGAVCALYLNGFEEAWWKFFLATFMGVVLAVVIERLTEYFTATERGPVTEIASASQTGPATLLLSGIAFGMEATVWQALAIGATITISYTIFEGNLALAAYGVALSGLGLLSTAGFILAMDTYGPISDNANGIFEMSGALHNADGTQNERAAHIVAKLDAVGNTTKALTKGFAIATAVVAAVSLFSSFIQGVSEAQMRAGISAAEQLATTGIRINRTDVFVGFLIGGAVPFLFSSFAIRAVGRSAAQIVAEVRRQFKEHPGIMDYTEKPDYARCVDIVTAAAQRELLAPALLAICTPIAVVFMMNAEALGGYLAGAILTGQLLAVFMSTSGGAWDNAKKKIEDGFQGGKGTDCHKASIIGDTVGDPFKDTAGPALNPLIKVMNLVAILVAPLAVGTLASNSSSALLVRCLVIAVTVALLAFAVRLSKRAAPLQTSGETLHAKTAGAGVRV